MNERTYTNIVSSFFYYMWNAWNENECKKTFEGEGWQHFWNKWCQYCTEEGGPINAVAVFYANLSEKYRTMLVDRATTVYNGNSRQLR